MTLDAWLQKPLVDRMKLYAENKTEGLEQFGVEALFPEKPLTEEWLFNQTQVIQPARQELTPEQENLLNDFLAGNDEEPFDSQAFLGELEKEKEKFE